MRRPHQRVDGLVLRGATIQWSQSRHKQQRVTAVWKERVHYVAQTLTCGKGLEKSGRAWRVGGDASWRLGSKHRQATPATKTEARKRGRRCSAPSEASLPQRKGYKEAWAAALYWQSSPPSAVDTGGSKHRGVNNISTWHRKLKPGGGLITDSIRDGGSKLWQWSKNGGAQFQSTGKRSICIFMHIHGCTHRISFPQQSPMGRH